MNYSELNKLMPIRTEEQLFQFWLTSLDYRKSHRDQQRKLAAYIMATTINCAPNITTFDRELDRIGSEFGALEAPGWPEDNTVEPEDYAERLWVRLEVIVKMAHDRRKLRRRVLN